MKKLALMLILALTVECVASPLVHAYAADEGKALTSGEIMDEADPISGPEDTEAGEEDSVQSAEEAEIDPSDDANMHDEEAEEKEAEEKKAEEDEAGYEESDGETGDEFLEVMPVGTQADMRGLPEYYADLDGNGYRFAFAVKTPGNSALDTQPGVWGSTVYIRVDEGETKKVVIPEGRIGSVFNYKLNCYYGAFGSVYIDPSIATGDHTISLAVTFKGQIYTGSIRTKLCAAEPDEREYPSTDRVDPENYDYQSGRKGSTIRNLSVSGINAKSGDSIKSITLVRNGGTDPIAETEGFEAKCFDGSDYHLLNGIDISDINEYMFLISVRNYVPYTNVLYATDISFRILENEEDGWCDIVITTEKGLTVRLTKEFYVTAKPVLWGMGYSMGGNDGEIVNTADCQYVAAYIYGLNIDDDVYPTYYDDGNGVTGSVAFKEHIVKNHGWHYLLTKNEDEIWNGPSELDLDIGNNIPSGYIDARPDWQKEGKVSVDTARTTQGTSNIFAADSYKVGPEQFSRFEIREIDSMVNLTAGTIDSESSLADLIPAEDRDKISPNKIYRVLFYAPYDGEMLEFRRYFDGFTNCTSQSGAITDMYFEPSEISLGVNKFIPVELFIEPAGISARNVTWTSSNEDVVQIISSYISTSKPGTAIITARENGGTKKAECKVTVVENVVPVTGISFADDTMELEVGDRIKPQFSLTPADTTETAVTMKSDNNRVIRVDRNGTVHAVGSGEASLTATVRSYDGYSNEKFTAACKVTVTKPAVRINSISLDQNSLTFMENGAGRTLNARLNPADPDDPSVTWSSDDDSIVTVAADPSDDLKATVSPVADASGETYVRAVAGGKTAVCHVTVMKNDASIYGDEKDAADADIWISKIPGQTYTGTKITPAVRVYDGGKKLDEGSDYTLSYENNTNAGHIGDKDKTGKKDIAPKAVVKFKGNYQGSTLARSFDIEPLSIEESEFDAPDLSAAYKNNMKLPVPVLTRNGKKLSAGKDYKYTYYPDTSFTPGTEITSITEPGNYGVTISGEGNYGGKRNVVCTISDNSTKVLMDKVSIKLNPSKYPYDAAGVTPSYSVTYNGAGLAGGEYTVSYLNGSNKRVGTATMILTGTGEDKNGDGISFVGSRRINFTVTGTALSSVAKASGIKDMYYTGDKITQDACSLVLKDSPGVSLIEGTDYTVSYDKNINPGSASVIYTGKGGYTGTLKAGFKILKVPAAELSVDDIGDVPYAKGGAKPVPTVRIKNGGKALKAGIDYTYSYKNNTEVTSDSTRKKPAVSVKLKGGYDGTMPDKEFRIVPQTLENLSIFTDDKAYSAKSGGWMSAPVITDIDGRKLQAGKDYKKPAIDDYRYPGKNTGVIPEAGTVITVTVTGLGAYSGSTVSDSYMIFGNSISKAKITVRDQTYSGMQAGLSEDDFTATFAVKEGSRTVNRELRLGRDFEIVSYEKNVEKGTASVTVRGCGGTYMLGGTKKISFKINAKTL